MTAWRRPGRIAFSARPVRAERAGGREPITGATHDQPPREAARAATQVAAPQPTASRVSSYFTRAMGFANDYLYTGRRLDAESGFQLSRWRNYVSAMGRWVSRDPIGYLQTASLYPYALGSPLVYVDPSGLAPPGSVDGPSYSIWCTCEDSDVSSKIECKIGTLASNCCSDFCNEALNCLMQNFESAGGNNSNSPPQSDPEDNGTYTYYFCNPDDMDNDLRKYDRCAKIVAATAATGAVGVWAWGTAGAGQFAVGIGAGGGSASHVTFGFGSGGAYTWAHGLGPGHFTTTTFAGPGSIVNVTGIPIASPGGVAAWVGTKPEVGNCVGAACRGFGAGWGLK